MELTFVAFGVLSGLELLLWSPPVWRWRKPLSLVLMAGLAIVSTIIIVVEPRIWVAVVVFFSLYRIVNLFRLTKSRIQADYLYHASHRASWWLISSQIAALGLSGLVDHYHVSLLSWLHVLAAGQAAVGLVVLSTTRRHLRTTRPPKSVEAYADRDLPSLTVAIPARNETTDLEDCLQSLVSSNYPKLEILVLDDCSQNKRTPEIIRGFAHDGVRFLAGKEPPGQWLAKNYAYDQLADEANGEFLLFCGVDARFEPGSLRAIVETALRKKKVMLSIVPRNQLPGTWSLRSTLVQPARYAWELSLPRRLLGRPPVLSSCWLISREALDKAGGFAAASRKAITESYLARQTAASRDGYSFLQSDTEIGISSHKSFDDQLATAIRTRYPQLHRRLELVALTGLAEFGALLGPLIILAAALVSQAWLLAALSGLAYVTEAVAYSKIVNLTYRRVLITGMWVLPAAALYDIGILNYSTWQYEFGEVIWKGRNVCIPLMRVTTDLTAETV